MLAVATIYFFLEAFHVPASARNTLLVLAVQSLATLLPFTPGGIGTQQGLHRLRVPRREPSPGPLLISFSVGMQIATTVCNVVLGLVALLLLARTVRWKQLLAPIQQEEVEQAQP